MANILGLITVDEVDILEVDADPSSGAGTPANCPGSIAIVKNVGGGIYELWQKTGTPDTAWIQIGGNDNLGNHIATQALNMSDYGIDNVADIDFDIDASNPAHQEGRTFYDKGEKALAVYNSEADITHQLGQEGLIRVYNNSGATITNGKPVYISGGENVEMRPTVALAKADSETTSRVIGVSTHDIENNTFGFVTKWGGF